VKRCLKSTPEPASLAAHREANPTGSWETLRNEARACYEELRSILRRNQGGLCAFCEISLEPDGEQVAHFHPKSDTSTEHNWALDWTNLWLACKGGTQSWRPEGDQYLPPLPENCSCDEKKGNAIIDGAVLPPHEIPAFPRIFRFEQNLDSMRMVPDEKGCEEAGIPVEKVRETIATFNLNCFRLSSARLAWHRGVERYIKSVRESNKSPEATIAALRTLAVRHLDRNAEGYRTRFFTLTRWRLGAVAEQHLQDVAYQG
jgi:uncharacterized protein (TIGR02646 family)